MTLQISFRRFIPLLLLAMAGMVDHQSNVTAQDGVPVPQRSELGTRLSLPIRWNAGLTVAQTGAVVVAGRTYFSSSTLIISWTPPNVSVDHYEIIATDIVTSSPQLFTTLLTTYTLANLKSGTQYRVSLKACRDKGCSQFIAADRAGIGATSDEYWQVQGTGNSYSAAKPIVSDGNVGAYVFKFGEWAGAELNGKLQLYYNPLSGSEKGVKLAVAAGSANAAEVSSFIGIGGFGLRMPCPQTPPNQPPPACPGNSFVRTVSLFQVVPMNGFVRLFFEANGTDQKNRILYLDSQDGYAGRDFNRGTGTICQTMNDYSAGGDCEPKVAVGVQGDAIAGNDGISNARQFKVIYPRLKDERWEGAAGTSMVFTVNLTNSACSPYNFTQGYAVWDGAQWRVQYHSNGCAKIFEQMQAPNPVHLGGVRYKLYYNNTTGLRGQPSNPQTDTKPMKVFYADGSLTGNPALVEFEDWEPTAVAREVHYLWPDGSELDVANESKLDDHVTLMPTGDPNFQVMYTNMSGSQSQPALPFIGMVVLINP
jgi:hypothetical protein